MGQKLPLSTISITKLEVKYTYVLWFTDSVAYSHTTRFYKFLSTFVIVMYRMRVTIHKSDTLGKQYQ